MTDHIAIYWFRQDLRLTDNPALYAASQDVASILPMYIFDENTPPEYVMGAASKWWLHHALKSLNDSLGGALSVYRGNCADLLLRVSHTYKIKFVYWNRCYEPWCMRRDQEIKKVLESHGIIVREHHGGLLWEPWMISKQDGSAYKVFTPFYRRGCLSATPPRSPLPEAHSQWHKDTSISVDIDALGLLPKIRWDQQLVPHWHIGEEGAQRRFGQFLDAGLGCYKHGRNIPAKDYVSRLSPHLHFGEISPNQLWHGVRAYTDDEHVEHFCSELAWREFSYYLLYHHPELPRQNLQRKFDHFPWVDDEVMLRAWQRGQTGIPMVDAGMRELWQSGYMHNRLRMIVGSFLVKNLRIHWNHGERWFWDTLVDADLANNSASWQWIAGCGADAAPYFRIFNPVIQGRRFDPDGDYVRRFVPEIASLPTKYLFNPWEAPEHVLNDLNIVLGKTYPKPIVDLGASREAALLAFRSIKQEHV